MAGVYQFNKKSDVWETPWQIYRNACLSYNIKPVLDVCATMDTTKCKKFFTKYDDGLRQKWDIDFFCNPPYSEDKIWIEKCHNESIENKVNGMALIFAKVDVSWWHEFIEGKAEVHNQRKRIRFLYNGKQLAGAPRPSCWVIWRNRK